MTERLRVLVVDDHADLASALGQAIELHGHEVHTAASAREGLALARELDPDVVFLDVTLPDMDGFEVARRLRRAGASALLVAFTGRGGRADARRFEEAGFDHHLLKPASLEALASLLEQARARRSRATGA